MPKNKTIREVMTANPRTVTDKDKVIDAARIMRDQDTGVVPVVNGKKIIGMVTDRDIVVRAVADGKNLSDVSVNDVMTRKVQTVKEDTPVSEVMNLMSREQIRRVPVVNASDELVGIVSIGDLATHTNQDGKVGQTVENISEAPPNR
ncbi:MAG: CBS domain-containing protein [Thermoanaerobaculia bacterium]|nr:CBS domain-containing protein [Thermoanaerobaculia bacterium]